jgi:hypothetical protein
MGIFDRLFGRKADQSKRDSSLGLQSILQELSRPAQLGDMPRRIVLCKRALELVPRQQNELLWEALQNELGYSLAQSPLGDRADNIEQAIEHYSLALKVRTEK